MVSRSERMVGHQIRIWLAGALTFSLIFPVAVRESSRRGLQFRWTWDALRIFDERRVEAEEVMLALFFLLPPVLGLIAFGIERLERRTRATTYIILGALPLLGVIVVADKVPMLGSLQTVLGFLVMGAMLTGTYVARLRPDHATGFKLAGIAGLVMLVLQVLPISPDITKPRENTAAILNTFRAPEVSDIGWLYLIIGIFGLFVAAVAVSLLAPGPERNGRARLLTGLLFATFFLLPFLPLVQAGSQGQSIPFLPFMVAIIAWLFLRFYACLGMIIVGISDLVIAGLPGEPPPREVRAFDGPDMKTCCQRIDLAWRNVQAGEMAGEAYREQKIHLLKLAIREARAQRDEGTLLSYGEQLRRSGALNDVEMASLREALT